MPLDGDIKSVLVIGAGPVVIGQACEFDYSGTQACKALREEGMRVILVNSNPATIMTDPKTADAVYIEPITWQSLQRVIASERPDALLSTVGGQTALNCGLELWRRGILQDHGVRMIGVNAENIERAENRELFNQAMERLGLSVPRNATVSSLEQAMEEVGRIGLPAVIRPSFTLGGRGGGVATTMEQFQTHRSPRPGDLPHPTGFNRRVGGGLEGVRDRGDSGSRGQCHRGLFHREYRSHGSAHGR